MALDKPSFRRISYASGEFYTIRLHCEARDAIRMNQTTIRIPILFPPARNSDMLENIDSFNDHLKRQRNIKYNERQKVSMFKNKKVFMFRNGNEEECQPLSEYNRTSVCIILHYLKEEKMIPTKENIQDFIRYGDQGDRSFDVEEVLKIELEHDMIVTQNLGDLSLYLPGNWYLCYCVNCEL